MYEYIVGKQFGIVMFFQSFKQLTKLHFCPWGGLLRSTRWKVTVHLNLDLHQSSETVIANVWAVHRPMVRPALKIKGCTEPYLIKLPKSFHGATIAAVKLSLKIMSLLTSYKSYCGLTGSYCTPNGHKCGIYVTLSCKNWVVNYRFMQ